MKILKIVPLFIFALLCFNTNVSAQAERATLAQVNANDVAELMEAGAMLIDVREANEVKGLAYDVEGVVNIPLSELTERYNELPTDKKLIMACRSGNRSTRAAHLLMENGYTDVANLAGGINDWQRNGLAVTNETLAAEKAKSCAGAKKAACKKDGETAKSCSGEAAKKSCAGAKKTSCCAAKAKVDAKPQSNGTDAKMAPVHNGNEH